MSNKINTALAVAKERAELVSANDPVPVPRLVTSLTMEEVAMGSMINDEWLKVKPFGLLIGASSNLITEGIIVEMNFARNVACFAIKAGNPAIYKKTYGGGLCVDGASWEDTIQQLQAIDPRARPYRSADIIMTVLENNGDAREGMVLGHSLSTTNWGAYLKFYNACRQKNLMDQDIKVRISHARQTNKAGNEWGILDFELLET